MAKTCKVKFTPDEKTVEVPVGSTILEAAHKAGVYVNSLCGGDGVCGRCRVVVKSGRAVGGPTEFFTREEIQQGYILACQGRVETDLDIEVPPESRLVKGPEYVEGEVPYLTDLSRLGRRGIVVEPLVRKTHVKLPPPTLENNISDLHRLEHELGKHIETAGFQMGLKVTRRLPKLLRENDWEVTAITGHRGPLTEIIDVEGGDTTKRNMCVVADVGTTTLVCHLVDCNGQTLGQAAKYNSQARFGADIIRRIIYSTQSPENENELRDTIVSDINALIDELLSKHRIGIQDVTYVCATGNTTMMHMLLGLPAEDIRKEPYVGAAYRVPPFRAAEVGLHVHPRGLLYCLPSVAGFVGADVVAGIFATGLTRREEPAMLIDVGTNGEIVIGCKEFLVCASASAGPAFEGAELRCGMRATRGALDHIQLADADKVLSYSTVGSAPPVGICGTGYVDLIAEMLRTGVVDKTGRIQEDSCDQRIRAGEHGQLEYVVVPAEQAGIDNDVVITQGDVSNILRAKGAIYAASSVLLKALDMNFETLSEIMVAGAFGNFLNLENAVLIGLLPDLPSEKLRFVGNTALAGAKLAALCSGCYDEIFETAEKTTYFELSTYPTFMDEFVSACFFPHTNVELFPSVARELQTENVKR